MTEQGRRPIKKSCGKTVSRRVCARRRLDGTSWDKNWDSHPALALRNEKDEGKERENRKGEKEILTALGFPSKASLSRTPRTGMEEPETTPKSIPTAIFMHLWVCAALMLQKEHVQIFKRFDKNSHITLQISKLMHKETCTRSSSSLYKNHEHLFTSATSSIEAECKLGSAKGQLIKSVSLCVSQSHEKASYSKSLRQWILLMPAFQKSLCP